MQRYTQKQKYSQFFRTKLWIKLVINANTLHYTIYRSGFRRLVPVDNCIVLSETPHLRYPYRLLRKRPRGNAQYRRATCRSSCRDTRPYSACIGLATARLLRDSAAQRTAWHEFRLHLGQVCTPPPIMFFDKLSIIFPFVRVLTRVLGKSFIFCEFFFSDMHIIQQIARARGGQ